MVFEVDTEAPKANGVQFTLAETFYNVSSFEERDWLACHDAKLVAAIHSGTLGFQTLQTCGGIFSIVIRTLNQCPGISINIHVVDFSSSKDSKHPGRDGADLTTNLNVPPTKCLTKGLEKQLQRTANGKQVDYTSNSNLPGYFRVRAK